MSEENELLEFKTSTAELPAALNSIVAMLNKHQKGCLYFGVKNRAMREILCNSFRSSFMECAI